MSATTNTIPVDPEKPGNVWCDACQQSLLASRANTHRASKKHADNAGAGGAASTSEPAKKVHAKKAPVAREEDEDEDSPDSGDEKKATPKKAAAAAKKAPGAPKKAPAARAAAGLPRDPDREGNLWCGICQVSLTPKQAEGHLETKRHQDNSVKHLSAAMKSTKISDQ